MYAIEKLYTYIKLALSNGYRPTSSCVTLTFNVAEMAKKRTCLKNVTFSVIKIF